MANFTAKFQAKHIGSYKFGYRTYSDDPLIYTVVDLEATAVGELSVNVEIPGTLYCANEGGITYNCWAAASCEGYSPSTDGVPDSAYQWDIVIDQEDDDCQLTVVTCVAAPIGTLITDEIGAGCTQPNGTYPVTVTGGGEITPAVVTVTFLGGSVFDVQMSNPGLYTSAPTLDISAYYAGCAPVPAISCTLGASELTDLDLLAYDSYTPYDSLTPEIEIPHGESITVAADIDQSAVVNAETEFTAVTTSPAITGRCHCQPCRNVTVDVSGLTGEGLLLYSQCWDIDDTMKLVYRKLVGGAAAWDLGCVDPSTVNVISGTLSGSAVITTVECT